MPDLDPLDDGTGANGAVGLPALVISEVNPGEYVELFNTTQSNITLPSIYWLCSSFVYAQVAGVVPAGGYATVPWPANFPHVTDANGEMMLYRSANFAANADILDYIIWGNPGITRKTQATTIGKWVGANATAITGGAIHRKIGVAGTQASDYDNTSAPSEMNCTPPPVGVGETPSIAHARIWSSPNPFKTNTNVEFSLDAPASLEVAIYAVDGSLVRVLAKQSFSAGVSRVGWDGTDRTGKTVASGTYLARISGSGVAATARVTHIR